MTPMHDKRLDMHERHICAQQPKITNRLRTAAIQSKTLLAISCIALFDNSYEGMETHSDKRNQPLQCVAWSSAS